MTRITPKIQTPKPTLAKSAVGRSFPLRVRYRESEGPRLPGVDWGVGERKGTAGTGARSARIVKHMPASQSLLGYG